ncbi:hypothetical protein RAS_04950 [Rickettsia asiatica]|uniref:Uncharacterized protein n=1 Tax=Rickettsia asiatica TaxID=238800 RepID=A0A510G781_9RICK|nr:hypothetical protein [Rickettsia asiatica]BBJ31386.1 hypothetical protein RAS_04950 [Rickettsia asiatica]
MLQALSDSVDTNSILQEEDLIDLSEDDSTLSPEISKEQNNLNDQQLAALVHQATVHTTERQYYMYNLLLVLIEERAVQKILF